jgi:acetyl esterase/lipase
MKQKISTSFLLLAILLAGARAMARSVPRSFDIERPSLRVFLPDPGLASGRAVIVCPGGGYSHLAFGHEGVDWAPYFNKLGIAVIVLRYRMPGGDRALPVSDALAAMKMACDSSDAWNLNPNDVGVMGSSAGGHLASTIATRAMPESRPNFQILFYPVITMDKTYTHAGSRDNFLGKDAPVELEMEYSNEKQVTRDTPRAFIVHCGDDKVVSPANAVNYYLALNRNNVPASLHIYPSGGHGWGFREGFLYRNEMLDELTAWLCSFEAPREDVTRAACTGNNITRGSGIKELKLPLARSSRPALFEKHRTTLIYIDPDEKEVVRTAVSILQKDVLAVFDACLQLTANKDEARVIVSSSTGLQGAWEAFQLNVRDNKLFVSGSDARGKAYGILEVSRQIGVSPWEWWADARPWKRESCSLSEIEETSGAPSVQYRGIFLNDEDWGLLPWASGKFEYQLRDSPGLSSNKRWKGAIGPGAYEKIFELLLRLRANAIWPAMHECTAPFYFVEGNREMAARYGIAVGSSHCEPLARNSASEWDVAGKGDYNFVANSQNVLDYWAERLQELQHSENIFTIGMRGKHDGMMQGVKTIEEHEEALSRVIPAQQALLDKYIKREAPLVFIPYKEVLEVYDNGLEIPDQATLVWCDDNYGYIRRLSNDKEQRRGGGAGVYYHASYWGARTIISGWLPRLPR